MIMKKELMKNKEYSGWPSYIHSLQTFYLSEDSLFYSMPFLQNHTQLEQIMKRMQQYKDENSCKR